MRAVRLTNPVTIGKLTRVIIPVEPGIASLDLPDQAFERE
jgi:hypothetical protein